MGAAPILTIQKNGETIKSQALDGECVIGRSEGCVIRLDDRAISRQHVVLRPVSGGVQIEKKSEVAPLSVNGSECTRALVKEGDVISIGPYLMRLSMPPSTQQDAKPEPQVSPAVADTPVAEAVADAGEFVSLDSSAQNSDAPQASGDAVELESGAEAEPMPEFSMDAQAPEDSAPVDLGEISVDEDAHTKVLSSAKVSARLVLAPGAANVTDFEINKDEVSIGRGKDCDVVLDDKKASRKHAIIRRSGVNFSIKDLDSANGTFVNDEEISERELSGDDILRIGNVECRFLVLSADYAANQDKFMPVPEEVGQDEQIGFSPAADANGGGYEAPLASGADPAAGGVDAFQNQGVSGLIGIGGATTGKKSLVEKFKAQPKPRQILILLVLGLGAWWLMEDDAPPPKAPVAAVAKKDATKDKTTATFESLTPEQKKFVESQHALAFDYYKNKEYDKAIFEIDKIFALIPDYKDSREIERYAKEGKRKLEALEDEKRKKDEEEKLRNQIAALVDQAKTLMDQKKYDAAKEVFPQILALDPDNQQVADWRRFVDKLDEDKRIKDQEKSVQAQINMRAWDLYKEGLAKKKKGQYRAAIEDFKRVADIGATDKKAEIAAANQIKAIQELIAQLRDPVLAEAKQEEDSQNYPKAFSLYKKATEIDPPHPAGYAGMDRIRGILHERAKTIYIDAVLSESYSDFETAKKKYQECKDVAPKDDIYYERAERKLATFFKPKSEEQAQ
jgi:pSer/pThr/pTyr-binding forkhead associated (FHA) protein/tetratricopeptide (TPR) repeat protein